MSRLDQKVILCGEWKRAASAAQREGHGLWGAGERPSVLPDHRESQTGKVTVYGARPRQNRVHFGKVIVCGAAHPA